MEREFKHTPAPWTLGYSRDGKVALVNNGRVAEVELDDNQDGEANAKLIAASPTMLQTLERIINCNDLATAQEYAREAINKATS